jgi:hypothetical protein
MDNLKLQCFHFPIVKFVGKERTYWFEYITKSVIWAHFISQFIIVLNTSCQIANFARFCVIFLSFTCCQAIEAKFIISKTERRCSSLIAFLACLEFVVLNSAYHNSILYWSRSKFFVWKVFIYLFNFARLNYTIDNIVQTSTRVTI